MFTSGVNAAKNTHLMKKKASNRSFSLSNFAQKSPRAHMSIPPTSGVRGLQRSVCLKSYNVQKQEIRFTLRLKAAKKYAFFEKKLQIKVVRNQILHKKVRGRMCPSPPRSGARGSKD